MAQALELEHVSKTFGGVRAVDDVTVGFDRSRITALIGPNGAGKTTLFHVACGSLSPDAGSIRYNGTELTGRKPWEIAQNGVGRLFQDVRVFGRMSVIENVMTAYQRPTGEAPWSAILLRRRMHQEEEERRASARELLAFVGLDVHERAVGADLSYGQQKLLGIARLLAADAELLLLDEPTAGVNPAMVQRLLITIRKLAEDGKTVIVIEHNMSVVMEIADWVYFMDEGQVVSFGLPEDVLSNAEVKASYLGLRDPHTGPYR